MGYSKRIEKSSYRKPALFNFDHLRSNIYKNNK
uniref:Uncharacterized protein n=1 Tax=Lepeophtheirus salmonis TaxID=72036 RepID=A0A0K2SXD6_LEPSM